MNENNRLTLYFVALLSLIVVTIYVFLFGFTVLLGISNAMTMFMIVSMLLGTVLVLYKKISVAHRLKISKRKGGT